MNTDEIIDSMLGPKVCNHDPRDENCWACIQWGNCAAGIREVLGNQSKEDGPFAPLEAWAEEHEMPHILEAITATKIRVGAIRMVWSTRPQQLERQVAQLREVRARAKSEIAAVVEELRQMAECDNANYGEVVKLADTLEGGGLVASFAQVCDYCRKEDCQVCLHRLHMDVLGLVGLIEPLIIKEDRVDHTGFINNHIRAVWGLRDALNDYFNANCDISIFCEQCPQCSDQLRPGIALRNSVTWAEDFGGGTTQAEPPAGATLSRTGPPDMVTVMKCVGCGYSRLPKEGEE